ncbi:hypothetical protein PMIN06_004901 [Paraphaeosphaeria minitans]
MQAGATRYDLQPLEDALEARGLEGIYTRDFMVQLSNDTANIRSGELSLAAVKHENTAPAWLRNRLTGEVNPPNPGLRTYSGHWYNSYLRMAAYGYAKGPDLLIEARHKDGLIAPPGHVFDPCKTCSPVQLTSHTPHQDDQLAQKQQTWAACNDVLGVSRTRTLIQLQIIQHYLQSGAPRMDKVVCMGLGSLSRQTGTLSGLDAWFRPYSQHIVALSIAKALDDLYEQQYERYGEIDTKVRVLAQDPGYSDSDKQVLAENGITVLEDPNGLLAIDENTFVMSAFPSFPLYEIIADMLPGSGPAAIFDASLPTSVTGPHVSSAMRFNEFAAPRVKKMLREWRAHALRWDEQELLEINEKLQMAVDWLPRMHLFLQGSSGLKNVDQRIEEDIHQRQNTVDEMLPSGIQWLRQHIIRLIKS